MAAIAFDITSVRGAEPAAVPDGNGNPALEVNRTNIDGYRLVSLTLAVGDKLPEAPRHPDAFPPVNLYLGHLDGKVIQFWTTRQNLSNVNAKRPDNGLPNMDRLNPLLIQLRERDVSKLTVTGDAIKGAARFGIRVGNRLVYWVVLALDAKMAGASVTGTYTWTATEAAADHSDTGKEVIKYSAGLTGKVNTRAEVVQENGIAPGNEYLNWRGDGSGCAKPGKVPLTQQADRMRIRWVSEDDTAVARDGYSLYNGGYNPPLFVNGRIYMSYSRPTVHPESTPLPVDRTFDCAPSEVPRYSVKEADEVVLCIDAATGVTLWKQAFIKDAENVSGVSKYGPWLPPCIDDGRMFVQSGVGHVYCLDIATGNVLWRTPAKPPRSDKAMGTTVALQAGDGVVLTADCIGLDAKTGAKVWGHAPVMASGGRGNGTVGRLKWVHEGVTYFVSREGCVRAKDGKECWKVPYPDPKSPRSPWPVLQGDRLVIPGLRSGTAESPTVCYRMYPDKLEKLWELSGKDLPLGLVHAPVIYDGHVYFLTEAALDGSVPDPGRIACVDLAAGKVTSLAPVWFDANSNFSNLFAQDGLAYVAGRGGRFISLRPAGGAELWTSTVNGKMAIARLPIYDGYRYPVFLDGRLFRHTNEGFITCYDLRDQKDK
jgi:outer membrane protein assembly factor BamB